jgi:hypothetical protein
VIVDSASTLGFFTVFTFVTDVASSDVFSSEPSAPTEDETTGVDGATGLAIEVEDGLKTLLEGATVPAAFTGIEFATDSKGASTVTGA